MVQTEYGVVTRRVPENFKYIIVKLHDMKYHLVLNLFLNDKYSKIHF
jgi:hypothetical protein